MSTCAASVQRLLCVDDDDVTRMVICRYLKRIDASVEFMEAVHGKAAMAILAATDERCAPELILLDLNMPVMDGWTFAAEFERILKQRLPATRIVVLTSSDDERDLDRVRAYSSVVTCFCKPLDGEKMAAILAAGASI